MLNGVMLENTGLYHLWNMIDWDGMFDTVQHIDLICTNRKRSSTTYTALLLSIAVA